MSLVTRLEKFRNFPEVKLLLQALADGGKSIGPAADWAPGAAARLRSEAKRYGRTRDAACADPQNWQPNTAFTFSQLVIEFNRLADDIDAAYPKEA